MRLLLLVFGTMALQNSVFVWASGHRTHHLNVDDVDRGPVLGAARLLVLAHRLDAARVPERQARLQQHPGPEARPDARLPAPLLPAAALLANFGLPLLAGLLFGDVLGHAAAGRLRCAWCGATTSPSSSIRWRTCGARGPTPRRTRARDNPVLAVFTYGEGYHNFHHIFAHDYRNGVRWWQWDPTKWMIARPGARRPHAAPEAHPGLPDPAGAAGDAVHARPGAPGGRFRPRPPRAWNRCVHASRTSTRASSPPSPTGRKVKEQWLGEKKRAVLEQWEQRRPAEQAARHRARPAPAAPAPAPAARADRLSSRAACGSARPDPQALLLRAPRPWRGWHAVRAFGHHARHGPHLRSPKAHDVRALEPHGEAVRAHRQGHHAWPSSPAAPTRPPTRRCGG